MANKDRFDQYDETAANNADVGGVGIASGSAVSLGDDAIREHMSHHGEWNDYADVASATTADIGAVPDRYIRITGTTTITGLGTVKEGTRKDVVFAGALTLTHNATSLILPGGANITTAAGDTAVFMSEGSGNWRCLSYNRVAGLPLTTLLDEDDMASDSATAPPSQQSVKAYVDNFTVTDAISGLIELPDDQDYRLVVKIPFAGTITETATRSASGTATATFKVNTTALGGTTNSVSSTENAQTHGSSNTFVADDDIVLTVSSNSSCVDLSFTIKFTRALS